MTIFAPIGQKGCGGGTKDKQEVNKSGNPPAAFEFLSPSAEPIILLIGEVLVSLSEENVLNVLEIVLFSCKVAKLGFYFSTRWVKSSARKLRNDNDSASSPSSG